MKDYERLMRGAHDGRYRKLPGDIYDQAAKYGINDRALVEELYSRACHVAHVQFYVVNDVYRRLLEEASGPRPVAPCKRTLTEALYGNPYRWAAPKPGVAPTKRTRTQTRQEELTKRERYLKMKQLVEEYHRQGIPLPNELRFKHYREVMQMMTECKKRQDEDSDWATPASNAASTKESEGAFAQVFDMMAGHAGGAKNSGNIPVYNDASVVNKADTPEDGHPWPTMSSLSTTIDANATTELIQGKGIEQTSASLSARDIEPLDNGAPLPDEVRNKMEALFGVDFSAVRIHVGPQAPKIGARAFTRGTDIFFAPGQYQPQTASGQALLAHELTHVVQQSEGRVRATRDIGGVTINDDAALERESDEIGERASKMTEDVSDLEAIHSASAAHLIPNPIWDFRVPVQMQVSEHREGSARADAEALYQAMHGLGTDEDAVISTVRGKSRAHLTNVMESFKAIAGGELHEWIASEMGGTSFKQAMVYIMPALSILQRLRLQKNWLDDNEEAMLEVIRTAPESLLLEARQDDQVRLFLEAELNARDMLKAAKILYPNALFDYTLKAIQAADGYLWDDEAEVVMLLLDLELSERRQMWNSHRDVFKLFSGFQPTDNEVAADSDFGKVMMVCMGTQAQALRSAMDYATDGLGTHYELVSKVVVESGEAVAMERQLRAALGDSGDQLNNQQRAAMQQQLEQLGGVEANLLAADSNGSEPQEETFLDLLQGDVNEDEFAAFTAQMGMDEFDRARRLILDAVGIWDDEEQVYRAMESIQSPPVREALIQDAAVRAALSEHFNNQEQATADAFAAGDTYAIAVHKLNDTADWISRDFGQFFSILLGMNESDYERLKVENRVQLARISGMASDTERAALQEILDTGSLSTDVAIDYATVGAGTNESFMTATLERMNGEERLMYRAGYALANGCVIPETFMDGESQARALAAYNELHGELADDLSHDDLQKALDVLVSAPTLPEYTDSGGYELIAFILNQRVIDRASTRDGGVEDGFIDLFSNAGGAADVAEMATRSQYAMMMADGPITYRGLATLGYLEEEFGERHEEYVAAADSVADIASTVAAIAAAVAVTVVTAGSGGAAAAAALGSYLGTSSTVVVAATSATLAGVSKVAVSEAVGGEHNDVAEEGAQDFLVGGVEGVMVALTAGIAKSLHEAFARMVGLRWTALAAEMSVGALRAAETSLSQVGKRFSTGAIRGVIDGVISGSVGEIAVAAMDEETYRKSLWNTLVHFGAAFLRGAAMGAVGGTIGGGVMDVGVFTARRARLPGLLQRGIRPEDLDAGVGTPGGGFRPSTLDASTPMPDDVIELLTRYGIDTVPQLQTATAHEAARLKTVLASNGLPKRARAIAERAAAQWAAEGINDATAFINRWEYLRTRFKSIRSGLDPAAHPNKSLDLVAGEMLVADIHAGHLGRQLASDIHAVQKLTGRGWTPVTGTSQDELVSSLKARANEMTFGTDTSTAYHTRKHAAKELAPSELPVAEGAGFDALLASYVGSARRTIANGTPITVDIADGTGNLVFERMVPNGPGESYKMTVRIFVRDGYALITTYQGIKLK